MLFANAAGSLARLCVTVTRAGVMMELLVRKRETEHSMKPTPKAFASGLVPLRGNFSELATNPARGLTFSR